MLPSTSAVRSTAGSWSFLLVSCGVVLGELLVRVLLGVLVLPVVAVVCPPLVTAAGVSVLASLDGDELAAKSLVDVALDFDASRWRTQIVPLATLAVVGHLLALGVGATAFLVVDTPIRLVLYWLGYGPLLTTFPVVAVSPLVGIALGTACAWAVPARAIPALVSGQSLRSALGEAVAGAFTDPRRTGTDIAFHAGSALCVGAVVAGGIAALAALRSPVVVGSVAAGVTFVVAVLSLSTLLAFHLARERPSVRSRHAATGWEVDVRRVGLVVVLVVALSTGAAVVRAGDHRPVDTTPEALPSDPGGLYETALSNTIHADHRYRVAVHEKGADEPYIIEHRVDRTDRQYRQLYRGEARGTEVYTDSGTESPEVRGFELFSLGSRTIGDRSVRAVPGYFWWEARYELDEGHLMPPAADAEGWSVAERRPGEVTLELTTPLAVFEAGNRADADRVENVTAARIRVVVDTERRTLTRATYRFEGTVLAGDGSRAQVDADVVYTFETGVDVERPDAVGARSVGEWLWRVFAY